MFNKSLSISVTILTKNSALYLREVLSSLSLFEEILVYDTGSTDETIAIATEFLNVRVEEGAFEGFGCTHNKVSSLAKKDWIFSLDSDEILSVEAQAIFASLSLDDDCVYSFPRHNYYRGQWIRRSGWYPDRQFRLYNRKRTRFSDAQVHEAVMTEGMRCIALEAPIRHYSYRNVSAFLKKMEHYTTLFAEENAGKKGSSYCKAVLHGVYAFCKTYFLQRGFLDGRAGFEIAFYNGTTTFYKYLKLWERNRDSGGERDGVRRRKPVEQQNREGSNRILSSASSYEREKRSVATVPDSE